MIRKAVIPAAGFGTRLLPAAKSVPKEMLPVWDKPVAQYVVEEAAGAGVTDVLLVVSRDKKALEDHFDRHPELEARLDAAGKASLLDSIRTLTETVRVHSVRQTQQLGLGHAVLQAREHVGNEPFLCLLGDPIFSGGAAPAKQLAAAHAAHGTAVIGLELVPLDKVHRYGIVGGEMLSDTLMRIDTLVEKPDRAHAPSRCAIAARYVLTPDIFPALERTPKGKGNEIQLTDALRLLLERGPIHGVILDAKRHDVGNPLDWLKTNLAFARQNETVWRDLAPFLNALLDA